MKIRSLRMRWPGGRNYCYELVDEATSKSWLVDPATPGDILPHLDTSRVDAIVNTHHHADHSGGNATFAGMGIQRVIGGSNSPLVTETPRDGQVLTLGSISLQAIHTPCHTQDSICYYAKDTKTGQTALFTGDTLFTAGCGRFFEGNAAEMNAALSKLLLLPPNTPVYPGHEYTLDNARFAKTVLGANAALAKLEEYASTNEETTGVFTLADEAAFNPFMRLSDPNVISATGCSDPIAAMARLRDLKNAF